MRLKIYLSFFITVFAASLFTSSFAQINPKTSHDIQLLLQEKELRTPAQKKMDSRLLQAAREKRGKKMVEGVDLLPANVNEERDGRLKVDIHGEITNELLQKIKENGGEIIYSSKEYHTVRALVKLSDAEIIAGYKEVKFIQPAVLSETVGSGAPARLKRDIAKPQIIAGTPKRLSGSPLLRPSLTDRSSRVKAAVKKYLEEHVDYNPLVMNAGVANSQGDPSHRTDETRNKYGYAGQGIKIGVLSDSYNRLGGAQADVLNDDLPGTGNPFGNTIPVTVVQDFTSSGNDEGRAMLQIIHDIAPKAQLYFATGNASEASFATNIAALRTTYGCDIVIDDLSYFDEPAFQDGIVAQGVITVINAGGMYFSSAGNSGSVARGTAGVWEGDFTDVGSPAFTGSSKGGTIHNFGSPIAGDSILTVGSGAYNLQWSDPWGASTNDYDLFLVNAAGTVKASSTTVQNGTQNPYEVFAPPALVAGDRFIVFKAATAAVRAISLNSNRGTLKIATTGQTHGHSCVVDAYCIAATPATGIPFVSSNTVETFSSDGLRRIFYNVDGTPITTGNVLFSTNGGTVRNKPDITAADGVATTLPASTGLNPFFGTSAAAPHAGAIAALLKSASPSMTPAQIRTLLTSTALDIQTTGYDNVSGIGIIQAFQAMQQINPTGLPYINMGTTSISEGSYSNGNGSVEPGETGKLLVQLVNSSLVNTTGVIATVTTTTPGVTITQGSSNYNTINTGSNAINTATPFTFAVNSSVACGTVVTFLIKIAFNGGVGTVGFTLTTTVSQLVTIGNITSTLGATPPSGTGYTVTTGQQTGRLVRGTAASTCAVPVANPGLTATTGARQYDAYTFTNTTGASKCFTTTLTSSNGANIYTAAYTSAGFVPANPSTNYLAEPGQSGITQTYSFTVAAGATFTVVVHDVNVTPASNSLYNLTVTYTTCSAPACTPVSITTSTIANGATGTPYSQVFRATGGSGSYVFSLTGDLPAGLSLADSTLSGTPTQAGSFPITVNATDPTGCPGDSKNYTLVISGVAPASVTTTAGSSQTVIPGTAFPVALQATVKDASNNPLGGVNVKFTAPSSGASGTFTGGVITVTVVTNSSGIATAHTFTANTTTGSYTVTANVIGLTPANFTLNNTCPASFVVSSNADSGPGTLRDVINNVCVGSTITFDPAVTLITLTSGELIINKAITINGPGANLLTIGGSNLYRIFNIAAGTSTVSISGMTIRDGKPTTGTSGGGGILISNGTTSPGAVNITGCVITNNDATFSPNPLGGGIDNEGGVVTIDRSSIVNNIATFRGGAIQNQGGGSMVITNSTVAGNTAGTAGLGGGIRNGSGLPLTLTNCTIFGNTAQGGGNISINSGTVTFGNTIIAGGSLIGSGGTGPDISGIGFTSSDYNLIQNTAAGTITGTTTHNITGVIANLLPLANNGGTTPTLLPAANSPAINTGNPALSGTDQRGLARVVGGQADIGAVEATGYTFYYSKSSGSLEQLATWGTNTDGTGTAPTSFTADNQIFTVKNNAAPMVADNWTVSGISSLLVGDGTNATVATVAAAKTVTIGSSTSMTDQANSSIIFSPASNFVTGAGATVNFNGRPVTLKSDATGTASLGRVSGTLSNATSVTVERYFSNKRAWRLLGVPFSNTTQTIKASWMEGATSVTSDPNPGFGTQITTFSGDANAANFDAAGAASSIRIYSGDNFNSDATHTPNTTSLVSANPSYFIFVRGNRSVNRSVAGSPSSTTILRAFGTIRQGNLALGSGTTFSLIPNPYPSAIDFDSIKAIAANSTINTFYVWDPSISSTGQYRTITISGTAAPYTYTATPGNQDNSLRFLESGAAFLVPGSRTVSFTEATKTTGTPPFSLLRTTGLETQIAVDLNTINADNTTSLTDGVRVILDNAYSAAIDDNDSKKIEGFNFNLGINTGGEILSVEKRPLPNQNDSIHLKMWYTNEGNYQFQFKPSNFSSLTSAYLYDRYLNTSSPVDLGSNKLMNFSITADPMSAVANRFSIVFKTSSVLPITFTGIKAAQKNAGIQVDWNIATESNINRYEIEKSADGVQFTKANETAAKANNNSAVSYNWYDATPFSGNNYYRIKVISSNTSAIRYSQVVNVKTGNGKSSIVIYPNPVKDRTISVQLSNQPSGKYLVQMFNALGQQMFTKTIEHTGGSATQTIQLGSIISKGVYQVHVSNGENKINQQVIVE